MRTKLLRKLRKKFSKRYSISRYRECWGVWTPYTFDTPYIRQTLQEAKDYVVERIQDDIRDYIREQRKTKKRSHSFNYYPW